MASDFHLDARLDEHRVLHYTLHGRFEMTEWARQHEAMLLELFGGRMDPSVPIVADIRRMSPPETDWVAEVQELFRHLKRFGRTKARCALVVGSGLTGSVVGRFYIKAQALLGPDSLTIMLFDRVDDAQEWIGSGLSPQSVS